MECWNSKCYCRENRAYLSMLQQRNSETRLAYRFNRNEAKAVARQVHHEAQDKEITMVEHDVHGK